MAIDTKNIPNKPPFDDIREALLDLEGQIGSFTGGTGVDADTLDGNDSTYYLNYNNLTNTPTIPSTTDQITEGSNLYYTDARADARVDAVIIDEDTMVSDSFVKVPTQQSVKAYVDSRNTDDISEGSGNLYHTTTRVNTVISGTVNQSFVNQLNVDADTLDGQHGSYYLDYNNFTNKPTIPTTSDDLTEGSTNLFFTNARADARVAAATGSNLDLSAKTTNDLSEGTTNLYYTDTRADARVNAQTGANLDLSLKSTTDLSEGTNLYFTNARADARIANNIIDEDTMVTNSETRAPSQQSVKAYVDSQVATKDQLSELSGTTDDVAEGTTNLYHTVARVNSVISGTVTQSFVNQLNVDADTLDGNDSLHYLNYNNLSNKPTIPTSSDDLTEGTTNLFYTEARFNTSFSGKDTDDLSVGTTNLYYTESLFDTSFSGKDTGDLAEDPDATVSSGTMYYTDARVETKINSYVDGAFISNLSGVDADTLNGEEGSYYLNYANFYGNYTTDYDNNGTKIARGVIYYVGSQTDIANVSTPTATFNFQNNTLTFTANGSDYSEAPPDSASTQNKVFLREWSVYNAYVGTETARPVSFTSAFESTQYNGPVTFAALKTAAATIINGDNITTGAINSTGFTAGTNPDDFSVSGTKLFLTGNNSNSAGDIISPQFKITSGDAEFKGSLASTSGSIGGWNIQADAIVSPDERVELNKDSGLQIKNSSGTPKVQIRSGALTGLTSKNFTFSGLSTLEFNTFNDTLTSNSEDFLYNGSTSLSAAANITSTNYGIYVEQISMNATPVGETVFTTSSDFIGNVNVEVRMDIATDSSFSNILKTVVLQTAGTSSAGVDVDFVADARNIEININQNVTTAYMRVYYYRNVFVGAGSVDFDTGSALTSFDFGQTNGVFAKTINQTELTDEGFQVIYDSNNYLKTSTVSASSEFVEIEGGLNLDGIALNVQNYASRTASHSDTVTANFYQRLSDTCIMQWGYVNGTATNPTTTFPLTFPKACRSVHVSTRRTSSSGNGTNYVYSVTASSFRAVIEDSNGQGRDFFWIAFGD